MHLGVRLKHPPRPLQEAQILDISASPVMPALKASPIRVRANRRAARYRHQPQAREAADDQAGRAGRKNFDSIKTPDHTSGCCETPPGSRSLNPKTDNPISGN